MLQPDVGQGGARLWSSIALDALDQEKGVGLLVEQGGDDGGRDGARPGLVTDVEGGDAHGSHGADGSGETEGPVVGWRRIHERGPMRLVQLSPFALFCLVMLAAAEPSLGQPKAPATENAVSPGLLSDTERAALERELVDALSKGPSQARDGEAKVNARGFSVFGGFLGDAVCSGTWQRGGRFSKCIGDLLQQAGEWKWAQWRHDLRVVHGVPSSERPPVVYCVELANGVVTGCSPSQRAAERTLDLLVTLRQHYAPPEPVSPTAPDASGAAVCQIDAPTAPPLDATRSEALMFRAQNGDIIGAIEGCEAWGDEWAEGGEEKPTTPSALDAWYSERDDYLKTCTPGRTFETSGVYAVAWSCLRSALVQTLDRHFQSAGKRREASARAPLPYYLLPSGTGTPLPPRLHADSPDDRSL